MRWLMLAILFAARLAMGFQFQSIASVSAHLIETFGFSFAQIGTLIGLFLLPGIFLGIPSGLLTRAVSNKSLLMVGAAVMAAGAAIMATAEAPEYLYGGRLLSGVGGVIFNLILTKMVTEWFFGKEIMTGLAILLAAWPIGIALGLLTQSQLAQSSGWVDVMVACSVAALIALTLIAGVYRAPPSGADTAAPVVSRYLLPVRQAVQICVLGFAWTTFNSCWILLPSFGPDALVAQGWTLTTAQSAASLMMWVSLLALPLGGRLMDKFGYVTASTSALFIIAGLSIFLLYFGFAPAAMFVLFGLASGIPGGAVLSLTSQAVTAENRGLGLGIFWTLHYTGMAITPAGAGWLRDVAGNPGAPLLLVSALMVLSVLAILLFRLLQARWPIAEA